MPSHVHAIITFHNTGKTINSIIGNGKRFMAYGLVAALKTRSNSYIETTYRLGKQNTAIR